MSFAADTDTGVKGKFFAFTGSLPTLSRAHAGELVRLAGGIVIGCVSHQADYLVAGADSGSRLEKAKELGVPIIDEIELRGMCDATNQVVEPFSPQTLAQKLAKVSYVSPTVPPLVHACRNCHGKLLAGQPCGARCRECALTAFSDDSDDTEDLSTGGAVTVALVAAALIAFGFVLGRYL